MNPMLLNEMLEKAFARLGEGYCEDAIETFSEYLLRAPNEVEAYRGRALAYFQIKNWDAAIENFKRARELGSDDPENWIGLGTSLALANQIYEGIDVFEALLAKHPHYVRGHIQLGALYYHLGTITKGHRQMDLALASRPSSEERRLIEKLRKEQILLDKKRYYRPDFEALRKQNKSLASDSWAKKIADFLNRGFRRSS